MEPPAAIVFDAFVFGDRGLVSNILLKSNCLPMFTSSGGAGA